MSLREWNRAGLKIRADVPLLTERATNEWCAAREAALVVALKTLGTPSRTLEHPRRLYGAKDLENVWHTVMLADGRPAGIWADHEAHAVVTIVSDFGVEATDVWRDVDGKITRELVAGRKKPEEPALFWMFELVPDLPNEGNTNG